MLLLYTGRWSLLQRVGRAQSNGDGNQEVDNTVSRHKVPLQTASLRVTAKGQLQVSSTSLPSLVVLPPKKGHKAAAVNQHFPHNLYSTVVYMYSLCAASLTPP